MNNTAVSTDTAQSRRRSTFTSKENRHRHLSGWSQVLVAEGEKSLPQMKRARQILEFGINYLRNAFAKEKKEEAALFIEEMLGQTSLEEDDDAILIPNPPSKVRAQNQNRLQPYAGPTTKAAKQMSKKSSKAKKSEMQRKARQQTGKDPSTGCSQY